MLIFWDFVGDVAGWRRWLAPGLLVLWGESCALWVLFEVGGVADYGEGGGVSLRRMDRG